MSNDKYRGPCIYRGKRLDNGEWVEGYYIPMSSGAKHFIYLPLEYVNEHKRAEIDPKTLSAWTGLEDKNGVKIFSGDVVDFEEYNWAVEWDKDSAQFSITELSVSLNFNDHLDGDSCEVIGNIWDNPELLGGLDDD